MEFLQRGMLLIQSTAQAISAAGMGCIAALDAEHYLSRG